LLKEGATVAFGISPRNLAIIYQGRRFERIHFIFPYAEEPEETNEASVSNTSRLVEEFFSSASILHPAGARLPMALGLGQMVYPGTQDYYFGYIYDIKETSASFGYLWVKKRQFDDIRYPGYKPAGKKSKKKILKVARELIFKKTSLTPKKIKDKYPTRKIPILNKNGYEVFMLSDLNTDDEESDNEYEYDCEKEELYRKIDKIKEKKWN